MSASSLVALIQRQLDAYNAKNLPALLDTYATDAEHLTLHGELLASGHAAMAERFSLRFAEPDLHARLVNRSVVGNIVTDTEVITRNFPEGKGEIEMLCIYEVVQGKIQRAYFVNGEKRLHIGEQ